MANLEAVENKIIICDKCGTKMSFNDRIMLTSYPPKYKYSCPLCGNVLVLVDYEITTFKL